MSRIIKQQVHQRPFSVDNYINSKRQSKLEKQKKQHNDQLLFSKEKTELSKFDKEPLINQFPYQSCFSPNKQLKSSLYHNEVYKNAIGERQKQELKQKLSPTIKKFSPSKIEKQQQLSKSNLYNSFFQSVLESNKQLGTQQSQNSFHNSKKYNTLSSQYIKTEPTRKVGSALSFKTMSNRQTYDIYKDWQNKARRTEWELSSERYLKEQLAKKQSSLQQNKNPSQDKQIKNEQNFNLNLGKSNISVMSSINKRNNQTDRCIKSSISRASSFKNQRDIVGNFQIEKDNNKYLAKHVCQRNHPFRKRDFSSQLGKLVPGPHSYQTRKSVEIQKPFTIDPKKQFPDLQTRIYQSQYFRSDQANQSPQKEVSPSYQNYKNKNIKQLQKVNFQLKLNHQYIYGTPSNYLITDQEK